MVSCIPDGFVFRRPWAFRKTLSRKFPPGGEQGHMLAQSLNYFIVTNYVIKYITHWKLCRTFCSRVYFILNIEYIFTEFLFEFNTFNIKCNSGIWQKKPIAHEISHIIIIQAKQTTIASHFRVRSKSTHTFPVHKKCPRPQISHLEFYVYIE